MDYPANRPPTEEELERWARQFGRQMRARLRKQPGDPLSADKFARRKTREALRGIKEERPRQLSKDVLIARYRPSAILDRLVPARRDQWVDIMRRHKRDRTAVLTFKDFSFITHPNETLHALKMLAHVEAQELEAILNFEDGHCLDAGAFLVLAEIWPTMAPVILGGRMAKPIQKVLNATGVGRNNRMFLKAIVNDEDLLIEGKHSDVWAFSLQRRRPAGSSRSLNLHLEPQKREVVADRFCDAIDEWLGVPEIEQELTSAGRAWLAGVVGELLCNAERHSQPNSTDGDWATTGFMVKRDEEGASTLKCYFAFLSVGRTIAESMADAAADVREALRQYVNRHTRPGRSRDTLTTVFALQDTITCDPAARESRSGGTGLQDVLDFVYTLSGEHEARVSIVSGKSCISLKPPYIPGRRRAEREPRLQWCNNSNSGDEPPDEDIAMDLSEHFAGTLVSVAFKLDPEYLRASVESENGND